MSSENDKMESTTPAKESKGGGGLPLWLKSTFRSRRTIKTWIRCCVALTGALILMVAREPSQTMGQAAFFCVIVSVMLPPTFALSVFIMAVTVLLFGMLLGWAWGNAAMASALSVRSASLFAQQQAKVQHSLNPNLPAAPQLQVAAFHGAFLDPRSSAVYGAFLFIGSFALGSARAYLPNLTLLSIFGTIVLDIICTTGPLLPQSNYTLAKLFILPTSFYVAVAIASLILVFPESQSHVWLTSLLDSFWTPTLALLRLQSEALASKPSDYEKWAALNARGNELRHNLVNATDSVITQLKLIGLDTSVGRLGPIDLKKINGELKSIMFRAAGLQAFQTFVNDVNVGQQKEAREVDERLQRGDQTPRAVNRFRVLQLKIRERELQHGHDLDSLVPILAEASANLRKSSDSAVESLVDWFQDCNSNRWSAMFSRPTKEQVDQRHETLVKELKSLEDALNEFRSVERVKLIKPYERFFDPQTRTLLKNQDLFASKSLYVCFVFIDTLDAFAESIVSLLRIIVDIDSQRHHAKIWFPGRIAKVTDNIKDNITNGQFKGTQGVLAMGSPDDPASFESSDGGVNSSSSGSTLDDDDEDSDSETVPAEEEAEIRRKEKEMLTEPPARRNPDAFPPTTNFGKSYVKLASILRYFKSAKGIFALRLAFVSVALWIPAVCPSSAWFYYDNKGVWALIMAQTALAVYAGDQIAGFLVRLTGTIAGLLIGMCIWYIGAGLGHGNPYGIVIATTAALAPLFLVRLTGSAIQVGLWTMASVTTVLVVGYSWINANFNPFGNPGVGVTLGWKRALLVIIGFTAAFIVMLFPTALSSRVLVRKTLAAIINESGNIFGGEIEAFLAEEERARNGVYDQKPDTGKDRLTLKERRVRKISRRVITVSTRLRFIRPSLGTAKFEPQLSGTWPAAEYGRLFALQTRMLLSLALLITSFAKLDTKWCSALVHRTPFMNPNFLSDVFTTLTILSNSLMNGSPLPAYLPKLRDRLVYHEYHAGKTSRLTPFMNSRHVSAQKLDEELNPSIDTSSSRSDLGKGNARASRERGALGEHDDDEVLLRSAGPAHVDGSSIGIELDELTLDVLLDEQLPAHSTAVIALSSLIARVDEMVDIVCTLCGQATFRGYDTLQRHYMDREEKAFGGGFSRVGDDNRR
ncbi:hypothetical protein CPB84DRAFT_1768565 [Gymnopilus junonius]|uniref:ER transporter 6TM N-terminal domain-containing protein n=1 Tax=Gymnopilus junonius TaxID=109634 RepID=A0A9P5NWG0_GYMJU|nr:hypothetical protein CPB84DRAFT_1768565 [Gymnopilus junonius]